MVELPAGTVGPIAQVEGINKELHVWNWCPVGQEEVTGARADGKEVVPPSKVCSCCTVQGDVMVELAYHGREVNKPAEEDTAWRDANTSLPMRNSSFLFMQVLLSQYQSTRGWASEAVSMDLLC